MSQALQKVLVPVDYSPHATEALHYAASLADPSVSELLVVHVIAKEFTALHRRSAPPLPYPPMYAAMAQAASPMTPLTIDLRQKADTALEQYLAVQLPGRAVGRRVEVGRPCAQILLVAEREQVNLIVMGTHGRTGLSRMVMGSVAEQIVRHAPCPVLTVKPFASSAA